MVVGTKHRLSGNVLVERVDTAFSVDHTLSNFTKLRVRSDFTRNFIGNLLQQNTNVKVSRNLDSISMKLLIRSLMHALDEFPFSRKLRPVQISKKLSIVS